MTYDTSLLIQSQLPEFIRDDPAYDKFVLFVQAYYEWMEQTGNITDVGGNILNYKDVDQTTDQFLQYFYNDFLAHFPQEILADKKKVIKIAKQLYQSKGTPASYQFLFRVLYNTDVDFFFTKEAVFKASSGKWYVAKSVRLASTDKNFLNVSNLRLFGETTKSIGTIENAVSSGTKMEVFLSDIERLFQSGEYVRVVDSNNQDVLFDGAPLRAKIVGQISQVKINPLFRGQLYQPGDPVIFHDGLNSPEGHGAVATVYQTTSGSIQRITVTTGGYGYTSTPQTILNISNAPGAIAHVGSLNPAANTRANVSFICTNYIGKKQHIVIGNTNYFFSNTITTNANTSLANSLTFASFSTYPISSVVVDNGGGGISAPPVVTALSTYPSEDGAVIALLPSLGILGPIKINTAGVGYRANDKITITGGTGYGAAANVISVNANGAIMNVAYVYPNANAVTYPLGGMGYTNSSLPTLNVISSNTSAYGASLYVPGILGTGATFFCQTDRIGSITSINISDFGEDYIATPVVSFRVQDIITKGIDPGNPPVKGDIIYQGIDANNITYFAKVDSFRNLVVNTDPSQCVYLLRVYDYNVKPVFSFPLKIDGKTNMHLVNTNNPSSRFDVNGILSYGDGTATGNSVFMNGLTISAGKYLDSTGHPSSFDVLQSADYNNYTYEITLDREIEKYRKTLLELLHPTGMKVLGRFSMRSNGKIIHTESSALDFAMTLDHFTGNTLSYASMTTDFTNPSNNIITFSNLYGANLKSFITTNNTIYLRNDAGDEIFSEVINVKTGTANTVTIKDNVFLTFANVALITANAGSNVINISSLTGSYNYINNGNYTDPTNPLLDIVRIGDSVLIANNGIQTVSVIDYSNSMVYLSSTLANTANSYMSVSRPFVSTSVKIYGVV